MQLHHNKVKINLN